MKNIFLTILHSLIILLCYSQNQRIKNVILYIPDGSSNSVLTLSRWYNDNKPLAIDEIICGLVKTNSSDSTIADSAPAAAAYATGKKSKPGFIAVDKDSIPQVTIMELAKLKGKSTGIVVTCEFPHATPADFVCHYPNRKYDKSDVLIKQFVYNSPSIVFSGGKYNLDNYLNMPYSLKDTLKRNGYNLITEISSFRKNNKDQVWALFNDWNGKNEYMSHDNDRDTVKEPNLAEMTKKAIEILCQNANGFILMVEGSQIDWSSHNNEPFGLITDFLAFDSALNEGLKFAKKNDSTLVIVCPDHGNGGLSIGNKKSNTDLFNPQPKNRYDKLNIVDSIINPLKKIKWTGRKLAEKIIDSTEYYASKEKIKIFYNLALDDNSINEIKKTTLSKTLKYVDKRDLIEYMLGSKFSEQHFLGWTTTGHTGDDVFLGIYAPKGINKKTGVIDNTEIAKYISHELNLGDLGSDSMYFNKVNKNSKFKYYSYLEQNNKLFNNGLTFKYKENTITILPNVNYYFVGKTRIDTKTLIVNINDNYFVPQELINKLDSNQ